MLAIMPAMSTESVIGADGSSSIALSRRLALAALLALIAFGLAWELWLAPTGRDTLAIKVVPLVLALPGLWRGKLYTFRWLSLLVWLYVAEGLVRVALPFHVEDVGIPVTGLIAIGRAEYDLDDRARFDPLAAEFDVARRLTLHHSNGRDPAQSLIDRIGNPGIRICNQSFPLVWPRKETQQRARRSMTRLLHAAQKDNLE